MRKNGFGKFAMAVIKSIDVERDCSKAIVSIADHLFLDPGFPI